MKNGWWKLALVVAALGIAGCGDDGGGDNNNPMDPGDPGSSTMTATVDGESWSALLISVVRNSGIVALGGGSLGGADGIGLAFPDTGTGDYPIGPGGISSGSYSAGENGWIAGSSQGSGSISVTTLTATRAVGTFSFTAVAYTEGTTPETAVITNGMFDVVF